MSATAETEYHFHYVPSEETYDHKPVADPLQIPFLLLHELDEGSRNTPDAPLMGAIFHEEISPESEHIVLCLISDSRPATKAIETPKGSIAITPTLHNALSALRRMAISTILLWIPEISLNSGKNGEGWTVNRVREMKKIYASSRQVVVFLGPDDENTVDAHELFFKLANIDMSAPPTSLENLERVGLPAITDSSWAAVDKFLCHPWFRSIQALPACVWAKNLQFAGERWSLDARMFVAAVVKVAALQLPLFGQHITSDELISSAQCFSFFCNHRARYAAFGTEDTFSELLRQCPYAEADSALERLAILAAISDKGDNPALLCGKDDNSSASDADDALGIIRAFFDATSEGLELLSLARGCAGDSDLPSWMPDVSVLKRSRRRLNCSDFQTATVKNLKNGVKSDGNNKLMVFCAPIPCSCSGHNTIAAVSQATDLDAGTTAWSSVLALWRYAQEMCNAMVPKTGQPSTKYPGSDEAPLEAVWETLRKGKQCDATAGRLSTSMASAKAIFMALPTVDWVSVVTRHFENAKDAMNYFADELEGWKFCVTKEGYMALVPQETEAGDVVMAVYGAQVPFVFRRVQETENYRLVGECYLHGVMTGELKKKKLRFEGKVII
jgi:hypothetical protein